MLVRILIISLCFCNFTIADSDEEYYDYDYYDEDICSVKGMDLDSYYNPHTNKKVVDEGYIGLVEEFTTRNVIAANFVEPKYLDLKLDVEKNTLQIFTTEEFSNYEKNFETETTIKMVLYVNCSDGDNKDTFKVNYHQKIRDVNTHKPKFNQDIYTYKFYTALKKDFDLTELVPISARDDDFSTTGIDFEIQENEALRITSGSFKQKTGQAYLRTKKMLMPPLELILNITAKDRTNDYEAERLSSTTTVQLILEKPENEIAFVGGPYEGKITGRKHVTHAPIHLINGVDPWTLVTIDSVYSEWFDYRIDYVTNSIIIELTDTLPRPRNSLNTLDLKIQANQYGAITNTNLQLISNEQIGYLCRLGSLDMDDSYISDYRNPKLYPDVYNNSIPVEVFKPLLNVLNVTCDHEYLDCVFEEEVLTIRMKEAYKEFEKKEVGTEVKTQMTVSCPYKDVNLKYQVNIHDNNTYPPTFDRKEYKYVLYDQVPKETELHTLVPITVEDLDISNNRFEIFLNNKTDNEHFRVDVSYPKNKKATVSLKNKRALDPGFETTIDLMVKDSGTPQKNSSAALTVKVYSNSKFEFTRSDYYAILRNNRLEFIGEAPGFINGFDNRLQLKTRSEFLDIFDVKASLDTGEVDVEVKDEGSSLDELETRIRIDASWKGLSARAVVHITKDGSFSSTTTSTSTSEYTEDVSEEWDGTTTSGYVEDNFKEFHSWLYASTVSNIVILCFALFGLVVMLFMARFYILPHRRITIEPIIEEVNVKF